MKSKKTTAKKKSSKVTDSPVSMNESVNVKRATNGYVVSRWGDKGEEVHIASSQAQVKEIITTMLQGK